MKNNGFSFVEVLISVAIFSILSLAMAQFASNAFDVMYKQGQQTEMADQTRFSTDLIPSVISKSYYIFPSGKTITLTGTGLHAGSISTTNSVVVLISDNGTTPMYYLKAFYLATGTNGLYNLYQFSSTVKFTWTANTSPAVTITSASGVENLIATDIDKSQSTLTYILNYNNGITDSVLKGNISGITIDDNNALIKGINWTLTFNKEQIQYIKIEGMSNNVPRFM